MSAPFFEEANVNKEGVMHNRDLSVFVSREDYVRLQRDYNYAVAEGFDSFIFKDREVLVTYAKYMIQYLSAYFDQHQ